MKKINKNIFIFNMFLVCCLIFVFTLSTVELKKKNNTIVTSNSVNLSNKKIGWGIKRNNNHEQPDVGQENKNLMEEYNGIYLGSNEKKYIYLTFDSGYEAGYTKKILEVLKNNNVKATFFITAHYLNTAQDLVKQMIDEGHIVGNHTVNHKSMPEIDNETIKKEIMDLHTAIYEKFGYEMKYIRPPKGEYSKRTLAYVNTLRV